MGASGQYQLAVPPSAGLAGVQDGAAFDQVLGPGILITQPDGTTLVVSPVGSVNDPNNLTNRDGPTKLTSWLLQALNLDAVVECDTDAITSLGITLRLELNGGTVWQQQQTFTLTNDGVTGVNFGTGTFADNIPNPIRVSNGSQLRFRFDVSIPSGAGANVILYLSTTLTAAWAAMTPQKKMIAAGRGAIIYEVQNEPGIRTL